MLDIANAYGIDTLTALERRFSFGEKSVSVRDSYSYNGDGAICECIVTPFSPEKTGAGEIRIRDWVLKYDADAVDMAEIEKHTFDGPADCYTIDLTLKEGIRKFSFSIE